MSGRPPPGLLVMLAGLLMAGIAAAMGMGWLQGPPGGADPTNAREVALGRAVYADHCARCHGDRLQGQPNWRERLPSGRLPAPPHDETGHTWHHPDAVLFGITKQGIGPFAPAGYQSDMPAFADVLTDAQIWAVLAFIKSQWPPDVQRRQARIDEQSGRQ